MVLKEDFRLLSRRLLRLCIDQGTLMVLNVLLYHLFLFFVIYRVPIVSLRLQYAVHGGELTIVGRLAIVLQATKPICSLIVGNVDDTCLEVITRSKLIVTVAALLLRGRVLDLTLHGCTILRAQSVQQAALSVRHMLVVTLIRVVPMLSATTSRSCA